MHRTLVTNNERLLRLVRTLLHNTWHYRSFLQFEHEVYLQQLQGLDELMAQQQQQQQTEQVRPVLLLGR